ncbi:MAG: hypothetical protein H6R26_1173 [Proteobacteria bacterium]|nr:hypothetical protein [Pseudomonadota bacterium]
MQSETLVTDITHVIQLAVAPVFLLTAIGTLIAILTARLGRVIDRSRWLEQRINGVEERDETIHTELRLLAVRMRYAHAAIALAVISALLVCLLISYAFIGAFVSIDLTRFLGALFVLAMLALIGCLLLFLREIFLAVRYTRQTMC